MFVEKQTQVEVKFMNLDLPIYFFKSTCENVVKPLPPIPNYCDACQCEWQRRNTTTIKVCGIIQFFALDF